MFFRVTTCVPHSGSGVFRSDIIFFPALAPFIATWNAEPNARSGRKNSTATRHRNSAYMGLSPQNAAPQIASAIPAPAPPYATRSIIVVLASCITSTFIVIFLNSSALSFILPCCALSALNIFNSFKPCTLSRNLSPIDVYLPQYFANIFFAYLLTAMIETGISGTQASNTSAVRQSIHMQIIKRIIGARSAKKNCGK